MVLAGLLAMRVLSIIAGAVGGLICGFVLGALATTWYGNNFAKGEEDITGAVKLFVVVAWPLFALGGAWVGYKAHKWHLIG